MIPEVTISKGVQLEENRIKPFIPAKSDKENEAAAAEKIVSVALPRQVTESEKASTVPRLALHKSDSETSDKAPSIISANGENVRIAAEPKVESRSATSRSVSSVLDPDYMAKLQKYVAKHTFKGQKV